MGSQVTSPSDWRAPKNKWLIASVLSAIGALALVVSGQTEAQDGPTAVLQKSLKAQQYYSGEITGVYDEATRDAVRRFQIRNGLEVTNELNAATLEAIAAGERQMAAPAIAEAAPEEPSARERARQFAEDDRQFLQELETGAVATQPPSPEPPEEDQAPPTAPGTVRMKKPEARQFLDAYLQAAEAPTPEREISFYADEVKYFTDKKVSKDVITKDQQAYYRRWPQRNFKLLGEPQITRSENGDLLVLFRISYDVQRGAEKAYGRTENIMRLRNTGDGPRIVAIRERKIKE